MLNHRSPDGSCILTNSNDNILRLFELPEDYNKRDSSAEFVSVASLHY